jgi:RNA polymerase sigma-70 factor (ECF subfamily)
VRHHTTSAGGGAWYDSAAMAATSNEALRDDPALVAGLRAGDGQTFDALIRQYGGRLLSVARRILGNDDEAREAVHEAFVAAFRARQQFHADARISTWLHRIAVNAALMKLRSRKRRAEESIDTLLPAFQADGHHAEQFASWDEPIDVTLGRRETAAFVREAIDRLPESYRVVLLLRDIDGLSTEEAAKMLEITPNAVKIRLHRARMALRTLLAPRFAGGPQ